MYPWLLPYTLVLSSCGAFVRAQSFIPSVIPLAVRSPYLNSWAIATKSSLPSTNSSAIFWFNARPTDLLETDWLGRIMVDGTTYQWLGNSSTNENVTVARLVSTNITPTRTIQVIEAGPMNMTITFLSPVEPSDWVKQSLSFSYLAVEAEATDGEAHSVQVYSDIAAQWASPIHTDGVNWTTMTPSDIVYHQFQLSQPTYLSEMLEFPSDGSYYYAMSRGENVTYKTCSHTVCRTNFTRYGTLANVENDVNFRAIDDDWPVFAMSIDLGDIVSTQSSPVVWAVGYNHNPAIQYTVSNDEYQLRSPLFMATYPTIADAIVDFLSDFSDAQSRAIALDNRVQQAASQVTADQGYYTLLSLSTRQAFSSMSITINPDIIGNDWNISDVMIFMKDMGFDGGVNPVDKMYASFPNFLFFNASLGGPLLLPLLQTQFNNASRLNYAATELGQIFPTSVDPTWVADEAVDQTANMLIMAAAHAMYSGDNSLLTAYYAMLNSWAGYLADNALYPSNQVSLASPTASDNSTNVAAKGIIGIGAMGTINKLLNYDSDSSVNYSSIAAEYASHWESLAFVTSNGQAHLTSTYGGPESSWALVDSLFGDKLLATGVISSQVYDAQTQFYEQLIEDNPASYAFGLPMDDLSEIGNSAALAMVAATMTNASTCAQILSSIASYASVNTRVDIFASSYYVLNGSYISGPASPAQGALFAPMIMSLSIPPSNSTTPPTSYTPGSTPAKSHTSLGIILGAVFGSVAGVSIFTIAAVVFVRHRRYKAVPIDLPISSPHLLYDTVTPFVPSEDGVSGSYVSPEDLRSAKMEGIRHAAVISRSGSNSTPSPSPPQSSTQPRSTAIPRTTAENATTRSASARSAATGSAATGSAASLLGQPDEGPGRNHVMTELRTEMSQLRQFMQSMNERMHVEAPPTYSE